MGLNESYAHAKIQVLMQIPTLNINQAYAMIINVESQRVNGASSSSFSTETSSEAALMSNTMSGHSNGYHNSGGSSSGLLTILAMVLVEILVINLETMEMYDKEEGKIYIVISFITEDILKNIVTNFMDILRRKEVLLLMLIVLLLEDISLLKMEPMIIPL